MISLKYTFSSDPSGYGSAARNFVASLFTAGINITTEPIKQTVENTDYGMEGAICSKLKDRNIPYKIKIIHLTPDSIPMYQEKGIYTISHLFWETDRLPKEWIQPLNSCDEIWTASPQMTEMIKRSGVSTLCSTFPQPIWTDQSEDTSPPFLLPFAKDFTFYSIFQWIDRKNPRALLRAYWKAFEGNDKVTLLLKTYRINYAESEFNLIKRDVEKWRKELDLKHYPKVYMTRKLLTQNQMIKLHKMGDCYVTSTSGEGWNRPIQEAMMLGKPVISADNGGITDLLLKSQYFQVPSTPVNATEVSTIPWYTRDMLWKEIDEDKLAEQMLYVHNQYDKVKEVAKKTQDYVVSEFSYQTVGKKMYNRLLEIYKTL